MMILKEFSRIVCVSLFSYQGSLFLLSFDSSFSLSHSFLLSRTFLRFFKTFQMNFCDSLLIKQLVLLYHIHFRMSTVFKFLFLFVFKKEKSASFRSGLKYIIECILRQVVFIIFQKTVKKHLPARHICIPHAGSCPFPPMPNLFFLSLYYRVPLK